MSSTSIGLATTSIRLPHFLQAYLTDARECGHAGVHAIVVGDRKSPSDTGDFCRRLEKKCKMEICYLDLAEQAKLLAAYPALRDHLPFDSIQRRNIGLLKSYLDGDQLTVTVDDDNFLVGQDYFGAHLENLGRRQGVLVEHPSGWFNAAQALTEKSARTIYHRGFPRSARDSKARQVARSVSALRPVVSAGLWLGEPDIDAADRKRQMLVSTEFKDEFAPHFYLASGTWCPFNSQNTALLTRAVPAYFLSPMIGRFDDIWASYVLRSISDHLGECVGYGRPLVKQERNPHNLEQDLAQEYFGYRATDFLIRVLRNTSLSGMGYSDCFAELVEKIEKPLSQSELNPRDSAQIKAFWRGLAIWKDVFAAAGVACKGAAIS